MGGLCQSGRYYAQQTCWVQESRALKVMARKKTMELDREDFKGATMVWLVNLAISHNICGDTTVKGTIPP